jgi:hypothetical protein
MQNLKKDSLIKVESYRIAEYETSRSAYEGHYLHFDTRVNASIVEKTFSKGDLLIPTDQKARKYLLEVLEPELKDSFFNWNFFDSILQRKEGFSPYVFEDYAVSFLEEHPGIKKISRLKKLMNLHLVRMPTRNYYGSTSEHRSMKRHIYNTPSIEFYPKNQVKITSLLKLHYDYFDKLSTSLPCC